MIDFQNLREQLSDESIKDILAQFNVEPVFEDESKIIFPTCCHNLEGGSPKLYYYKDSKLFHCFTECSSTFDIFNLLQKMYELRGQEINVVQAVALCNLDTNGIQPDDESYYIKDDLRYMETMNSAAKLADVAPVEIKTYDKSVLRHYSFDYAGLMPWIEEGIGIESLQKFNIKYDTYNQAIVIPNFNYDGELIGIRERFFREKDIARGKYRPLLYNGILYNHPTGRTFYGIFENHKTIERKHMAIIWEGEKSVLKQNTLFGADSNVGLATLGQNITKDHIQALIKMDVRDVILAYDTDYEDYKQLDEVEQKYLQKGKILSQFFNVSILMDYDFLLPYKSSPIDGGKEIFEKILAERRIVI